MGHTVRKPPPDGLLFDGLSIGRCVTRYLFGRVYRTALARTTSSILIMVLLVADSSIQIDSLVLACTERDYNLFFTKLERVL